MVAVVLFQEGARVIYSYALIVCGRQNVLFRRLQTWRFVREITDRHLSRTCRCQIVLRKRTVKDAGKKNAPL